MVPSLPLSSDPLLRDVPEVDGWKLLQPAVLYAKIGQGGMGAVYRGRHVELEIDVAVKCLKPSLVAEDEQFEARFRREARLAAELTHENLVRLYELRRAHGLSYLILEFVEGETARDRVARKGPLREEEAASILWAASKGLAKAHRHHEVIVHRDIKPENILVSKRGEVKVADLGIAKALEGGDDATFTTQGAIGTPAYMAPEQWEDSKAIGPWTDVWSLGATLYFLLVGKTAVRGGSAHQISYEVCNRPFPDIHDVRPDLSQPLKAILTRCTHKETSKRYPDAYALARALEDFLGANAPSLLDKDTGKLRATEAIVSPPPAQALRKIRAASSGSPSGASSAAAGVGATVPLSSGAASAAVAPSAPVGPTSITFQLPRTRRIVGAVVILVALVGLGWFLMGDGAKSLLRSAGGAKSTVAGGTSIALDQTLRDGVLYSRASRATLSGRVDDPDGEVLSVVHDGRRSERRLDSDGRFEFSLDLPRDRAEKVELSVGVAAPFTLEIVQDSTPPRLTVRSPAADARRVRDARLEIRVEVEDANPVRVLLGADAMTAETDGTWVARDVTLSEGRNDLPLLVEDVAGNRVASPLAIELDTRGPVIASADPASGATVAAGSQVHVQLEFDEPIARLTVGEVDARIDGRRASADVRVPAGEGAWSLPFTASDALSNSTTGELLWTRVARLVPRIVLDPPLPADRVIFTRETSLEMRGRVENAVDSGVRVETDGRVENHALGTNAEMTVPVKAARGRRSRVALLHGAAGSEQRVEFEVIHDAVDPILEIVRPAASNRATNRDTVDVAVRVTDENLEWVRIGTRSLELQSDGLWTVGGLSLDREGANTVRVTAHDRAGREGTTSLDIVLDTLGPELREMDPPENRELLADSTARIQLTFGEELASATLNGKPMSVTGKQAALDVEVPSGTGPFALRWTATDLAGNSANGSMSPARGKKPISRVPEGWKAIDETPEYDGWARRAQELKSQIVFVLVKPDKFMMGSPDGELGKAEDEVQHEVEITKPFYLAETETTDQQYATVVTRHRFRPELGKRPAINISWVKAREFCRAIGCDLPTEAQWEFACRAGTQTTYSFGNTLTPKDAQAVGTGVFGLGGGKSVDVGSFPANAWGLYDMHGNVREWCRDAHGIAYHKLDPRDPYREGDDNRVVRGGSARSPLSECRAAVRKTRGAIDTNADLGFRASRDL